MLFRKKKPPAQFEVSFYHLGSLEYCASLDLEEYAAVSFFVDEIRLAKRKKEKEGGSSD